MIRFGNHQSKSVGVLPNLDTHFTTLICELTFLYIIKRNIWFEKN